MEGKNFSAHEEEQNKTVPQSTESINVANEPQVINNKGMEAGVWQ